MLYTDAFAVREALASAPGVVLIDFSAEWCAPCRALEPVLDQLEAETPDLTVVRVDVDDVPDLAAEYGVMSFPTLLFFTDGQLQQRLVGARGISALREELAQLVWEN
jgi:thioredoxin 1